MTTYKVELASDEMEPVTIECASDVFVLDAAEDKGLDFPYSWRAGACSTCAGKVI